MNNEHALTVRTPDLSVWQMIESIAPVMQESRMFGVASKEQAAAIMLKGYELGLGLSAAFEFIHVIEGKPSLSPKGVMALIHKSGQLAEMDIQEGTDKNGAPNSCTVTMERTNGFSHTITFTMDDAKRAGLVKPKGGWEKYPANMLRWRAIGYCADIVFPDLIGGMYRPEELGAVVDADGDVIEGTVVQEPRSQASEKPAEPEIAETASETEPAEPENAVESTAPTLADLVNQYGVEVIMAANNNTPPATDADLIRLRDILAEGE
jgi:hypothetical protein